MLSSLLVFTDSDPWAEERQCMYVGCCFSHLRQGSTMKTRPPWHSLCRPGWSWTRDFLSHFFECWGIRFMPPHQLHILNIGLNSCKQFKEKAICLRAQKKNKLSPAVEVYLQMSSKPRIPCTSQYKQLGCKWHILTTVLLSFPCFYLLRKWAMLFFSHLQVGFFTVPVNSVPTKERTVSPSGPARFLA